MTKLMTRIAALLATTACQQQPAPPTNPAQDNAIVTSDLPESGSPSPPVDGPPGAPPPPVTPAPAPGNDQPPAPHPDPDAPPVAAEKTALGAAWRLQEYCDAVATKHYPDAYPYWSDRGRASGMTLAQFRDSFAKYRAYDCHIGTPGETEGAAGSIYVTIPLQVTGVLTRGGGFRLEGAITMRRVNDVDGSTAEQRRWHIASSGLKPRR